jgi:glycosyltransferase involved in cell wall biosynthesis
MWDFLAKRTANPTEWRPRLQRFLDQWTIRLHMRKIQDAAHVPIGIPVTLVCIVRDAENTIGDFVRHYERIGIQKFVIIDNDSGDNTLDILRQFKNVTIYKTALDFGRYKKSLRYALFNMIPKGEWCLMVDDDEFLNLDLLNTKDIGVVINYLEAHDFNLVRALMLDFYPDSGMFGVDGLSMSEMNFFELRSIYQDYSNVFDCSIWRGGVRKRVFDVSPILTKFPLIKRAKGLSFFDCHGSVGPRRRIADIDLVIEHVKFCFLHRVEDNVARKTHFNKSSELAPLAAALRLQNIKTLKCDISVHRSNLYRAVEMGYVIVNKRFFDRSHSTI